MSAAAKCCATRMGIPSDPTGIATIALYAIALLSFAFAVMNQLEHREQAFQASSPKNFYGLVFGSALFFVCKWV